MDNGISLILMGVFTFNNFSDIISNNQLIYDRQYDWEPDLQSLSISVADFNKPSENFTFPSHLKVTTWNYHPYSWVEGGPGNWTGRGHAFTLFNEISKKLGFTYEIIMPKDPSKLGGETGVMQLLANKMVDVAVAFLPILPSLYKYGMFSPILDKANFKVILKRPSESAVGSGLLAPFDTTVWFCILASLIICGPIIFFITSYRCKLFDNTKIDKFSFTACVWFTYGAILKQGSVITPTVDSNRLLFATWWIFITILTSFYTANLTAFLTLSEFTLEFKSLQDIIKLKRTWRAFDDQILEYNIVEEKTSELEGLRDNVYSPKRLGQFVKFNETIEKKKIKLNEIKWLNKTLQAREDEKFQLAYENFIKTIVNKDEILFMDEFTEIDQIVFHDFWDKARLNYRESAKCAYVIMPQPIFFQNRGFAYPNNSKIQDVIDNQLLRFVEMGIIKHIQTNKTSIVQYCPLNLKSKERQLKNSDLALTYKVIGSGFISAGVMFFGEIFYRCFVDGPCLCCRNTCRCCGKRGGKTKNKSKSTKGAFVTPASSSLIIDLQKITPIYENIYNNNNNNKLAKKHLINGRDYWIIKEKNGDKRLVPIRTPSALLFQYTS